MKKIIVVSLFLFPGIVLMAQVSGKEKNETVQVSAEARGSFHKDFPTSANELWEKEGGYFEVHFKVDNKEMSALYTKSGYRKEVEREIEENKLPSPVFDYILKNYQGFKLKSASEIKTDKAVLTYEAEISNGTKTLTLIFDSNGKFKKKE